MINNQIPPTNNNGSSLTVEDVNNVQVDGYTDAQNTQDLIAQNQQNAKIIPGGPDPYSQSVIEAYNSQFAPDAIGPQGKALYPGLGHNINVGNYSGSIVGSQGIYVPGGNIQAIDPILARRKAIEDAAKARASSLVPFEPESPTQLKDPRFQQKFDNQVLSFQKQYADEMRNKYGKDWTVVASDPNTKEGREFIQAMANFETMQRNMDGITDRIALIDKGLESGELEYSDETLKLHDDYKRLVGAFEGGDPFKTKDLQSTMDKLDGFLSLEHYLNQDGFLDNIMGEKGAWSQITDQGEYFQTSTGTRVTYDEAIEQVANSLASGPMRPSILRGYMDRGKIVDVLKSKFKNQATAKKSISQKRADAIITQEISAQGQSLEGERSDNNYTYNEDGTLNTSVDAQPGAVFGRWDMNIQGDSKEVSWKDGKGNPKSLKFKGIKFTQPTILNGNNNQEMEGDVVSQISGFSVVDRGNGPTLVANTTSYVPTKQRYDKDGERIPYEQWEGAGGSDEAVKTEVEYREVQTPVVLVSPDGEEKGSFEEIVNQVEGEENKKALRKAYNEMNEIRKQKSRGNSGAAGDDIFK